MICFMATNRQVIFPEGKLTAEIELPTSKSLLNRALILASLCDDGGKECAVLYATACDDSSAIIDALACEAEYINIGAAGTAMRFLTGKYAATVGANVVLDGSARMRKRPIKVLVEALRACGAKIEYIGEEGFPPLKIKGANLCAPLDFHVDSNISSQYISSLLMIAPRMQGGMTLHLDGECRSLPYIDMTIALMQKFGAEVLRKGSVIKVEQGTYRCVDYDVEADWSAASYWYEIAALRPGSRFRLRGLHADSLQGDSRVAEIFRDFGVKSSWENGVLLIESGGACAQRLDISLNEQPDLAQTVVATAAALGVPFILTGLSTLRIKETDRIAALQSELAKVGVDIRDEGDDALVYDGKSQAASGGDVTFATYDDHRMAMSLAPLALVLQTGKVIIENADVVSKSYPEFWQNLAQIVELNEAENHSI